MKNFKYTFKIGALALCLAGFAACSSEEELVDVNPTYNPETGELTTTFVFNVETGNTTTRMSAANTQSGTTPAFRGISDAYMVSYKQANDGLIMKTPETATKTYILGDAIVAGGINLSTGTSTGNTTLSEPTKSRRVLELALPAGTNTLMFWGKAPKTGTNFQQGSITYTVDTHNAVANNSFKLNHVLTQATAAETTELEQKYAQYRKMMAAVLTRIVKFGINGNTNYNNTALTIDGLTPAIDWSSYVTITTSPNNIVKATNSPVPGYNDQSLSPSEDILADAYVQLNKIYEDENRAGSGGATARMMGDLIEILIPISTIETPSNAQERWAKAMATQLINVIHTYFSGTGISCAWLSAPAVKTAITTFDSSLTSQLDKISDQENINQFPITPYNLPYGAALLSFDNATREYSYIDNLYGSSMGAQTWTYRNYCYPAELCYFGNSPIHVSAQTKTQQQYPDGAGNGTGEWLADESWGTEWNKNSHVLSTTRSVAMRDNINYGVAALKTTVRYAASTLEDNNAKIQHDRTGATEANKTFDVQNTANQFELTGILIGGQEAEVGWNYVAKADADHRKWIDMIYDKDITNGQIPAYTSAGAKSAENYTLVWDNWNESNKGAKQNDVYIALEFKNNTGENFWGEKNMVRSGGTFYVIGKLDPDYSNGSALSTTDRSAGITWPTNYALPPYDNDGNTIKERRVFIQDYVTSADFTLTTKSLQHAYIVVPDLRSTQISLGLSVDMSWSQGPVFEDVTLGDTPTP